MTRNTLVCSIGVLAFRSEIFDDLREKVLPTCLRVPQEPGRSGFLFSTGLFLREHLTTYV